jgi:hypothetical protein
MKIISVSRINFQANKIPHNIYNFIYNEEHKVIDRKAGY